jgi:lipid A 3-O-deacylase
MKRLALLAAPALLMAAPALAQTSERELRVVVSQHDILHLDPGDRESGVNLEIQALSAPLTDRFGSPRALAVASFNSDGDTSFAGLGVAWTKRLSDRWSGELQFGLVVHDGELEGPDPGQLQLGSRVLFRTALGVDYSLNEAWALGVQWEHLSHGEILAGTGMPNQGLDTVGVRLSRRF